MNDKAGNPINILHDFIEERVSPETGLVSFRIRRPTTRPGKERLLSVLDAVWKDCYEKEFQAIHNLIEHGPMVSRERASRLMDELQGAILFDVTHHIGILDRAKARNIITKMLAEIPVTVEEGK